jgi:hypothetical protein
MSNSASPVGALPPGWTQQKTEDGRTYYFNASKNATQWERPVDSQFTQTLKKNFMFHVSEKIDVKVA